MGIAALALGAVGCTDVTSTNRAADGTYVLATVNGNPLPFQVQQPSGSVVTIESDVYTLSADNTYTEMTTLRLANGQTTTASEQGDWAQSNTAVQFMPTVSSSGTYVNYTGSLSGGGLLSNGLTLTIGVNGVVEVYEQQ
jgi:hypothetical protein